MSTTSDIQAALLALGYDLGPDGADGKMGAATRKAIKAFQVANALTADGKVGQLTRAVLFPEEAVPRDDDLSTFPPSAETGQWPLQRDCMTFYGGVGLNQKTLALPFPMRLAWDKSVVIKRFSIHEKVHDSAARAFGRIDNTYSEKDRKALGLDLFGGCLNVRKMRGGNSYSMHSWGIAIDFDPERNQLRWGRDRAHLAKPEAEDFWKIWEDEGWISLGRERNFDWMHVQAARLS